MYLVEINDKQESAWCKNLEVFDEDRELPADAIDSLQVRLSGLQLRRPRALGNGWLACELWHQLGLEVLWRERLEQGREVVNRLIDPGSELRVHRQWFLDTAMDELLNVDFALPPRSDIPPQVQWTDSLALSH